MNHIFISHAHEQTDFAEVLERKLSDNGFKVWRDSDGIISGSDWRISIDRAIREGSVLIVAMSRAAKASEYVTYEWAFAWGAGVKVIPLLLEETEIHPRLATLQYLDFRNSSVRPWDQLIERLRNEDETGAEGIPARGRLHGYSGAWQIDTTFTVWQCQQVVSPAKVVFEGTMYLILPEDGERGSGTQVGELYVSIGDWNATYQIANLVTNATVGKDGTVVLDIRVRSRTRIKGDPPPVPYRDDLFGSGEFEVHLAPAPGSIKTLTGGQKYPTTYYQEASDIYRYIGFYAAPK